MSEFTLGQRVRVRAEVRSYIDHQPRESWGWDHYRRFEPVAIEAEGIVAGLRTLYEGQIVNWGDDGNEFRRSGSVPVVLVATSMRRRLLHVRPEDVEPLARA